MRNIVFVLLAIISLGFARTGFSATSNTVQTAYTSSRIVTSATAGEEPFWIALNMTLQPEWHVYWKNPGDSGIPTQLDITLPEGFSIAPLHWQHPKRFDSSGIVGFGYEKDMWLFAPITPPKNWNTPVEAHIKASWLICRDICLPEEASFTLNISPSEPESVALKQALSLVPSPIGGGEYQEDAQHVRIQLPWPHKQQPMDIFTTQSGVLSHQPPTQFEHGDDTVTITIEKGSVFEKNQPLSLVVQTENAAYSYNVSPTSTPTGGVATNGTKHTQQPATLSLISAILFGLLGGLILNVMPCVLPVLSLKAISLTRKAEASYRTSVLHGVSYTGGVLVFFAILGGLLILLRQAGMQAGWGFQLQSPEFVYSMCLLMLLIGLVLSGVLHIPGVALGAGGKDSYGQSFFTGALAAIVATPCTAPLMAPALGYALTQPVLNSMLVTLSVGLGMALPLLLIAIIPAAKRLLPKPGAWMERFKQCMAFPMYATSAWLLWVLSMQVGDTQLAWALVGIVLLGFTAWLSGQVRRVVGLAIMAVVILLFIGIYTRLSQTQQTEQLHTEPYSAARLNELRADGKPVFVYATAAWCITCKINEATTLEDAEVIAHLNAQNISVLQADWTNKDAEITRYITSLERSGVPVYVWYAPKHPPVMLPQILSPAIMKEQLRVTTPE